MIAVAWQDQVEKFPVNVIPLPLCECEVCGKRVAKTKIWNEKEVCGQCIEELTADVETD